MFRSIVLFPNMVLMDTPITSLLNSCLLPIGFCFRSHYWHSNHKTRWKQSIINYTDIIKVDIKVIWYEHIQHVSDGTRKISLAEIFFQPFAKGFYNKEYKQWKVDAFTMFNIEFWRHTFSLCSLSQCGDCLAYTIGSCRF